jgi:Lon protease-like protein
MPAPGSTDELAMFPLGTVLVPGMQLALHVFEPRYRRMMADLLNMSDRAAPIFGVAALRKGWEVGELGDVYPVGTTARITDVTPLGEGRCDVTAVGERRFRIESLDTTSSLYLRASVRYLGEDDGELNLATIATVRLALTKHAALLAALDSSSLETAALETALRNIDSGNSLAIGGGRALSYAVAEYPALSVADRQQLLECADTSARLVSARRILRRESRLLSELRAIPTTAAMLRLPHQPS